MGGTFELEWVASSNSGGQQWCWLVTRFGFPILSHDNRAWISLIINGKEILWLLFINYPCFTHSDAQINSVKRDTVAMAGGFTCSHVSSREGLAGWRGKQGKLRLTSHLWEQVQSFSSQMGQLEPEPSSCQEDICDQHWSILNGCDLKVAFLKNPFWFKVLSRNSYWYWKPLLFGMAPWSPAWVLRELEPGWKGIGTRKEETSTTDKSIYRVLTVLFPLPLPSAWWNTLPEP